MSNAFSFVKISRRRFSRYAGYWAVSSGLVVYGKNQQFFTRDLPVGSHHFVKELSEKKEIGYIEAQDTIFKDGLRASKNQSSDESSSDNAVGIAERTVYDSLVEDMRRSLRFYAKQTGQSFFLKIFLTGGGALTPGLADFVNQKLNIECAVFDPFENVDGKDNLHFKSKPVYNCFRIRN